MPIFEFNCDSCDTEFEILVQSKGEISCPDCSSTNLTKRFSTFATSGQETALRDQPGPCGTCGDPRGAGSCAM